MCRFQVWHPEATSDGTFHDGPRHPSPNLISESCIGRVRAYQIHVKGIGSGRASLARKVHALTHSVKMQAPTWAAAADILSATVTWTGDLGTESLLWTFKGTVSSVFGRWVVSDDRDRHGATPEEREPGFRFEGEHAQSSGGSMFDIVPEGGTLQPRPETTDDEGGGG